MRPTKRIDPHALRLAASKQLGEEGISKLRRLKLCYDDVELRTIENKHPTELTPEECAMIVEVSRRTWLRWSDPESGKWILPGPVRLFCLETGLDFDDWDPLS